jgi:hypothetical protein
MIFYNKREQKNKLIDQKIDVLFAQSKYLLIDCMHQVKQTKY